MAIASEARSFLLVLVVSLALVLAGLKRRPGIGVIAAIAVIGLTLWLRGETLGALGFGPPGDWATAVAGGLALGVVIQILSVALLEPLAERITGVAHDHSVVENVRGSWVAFLQWTLTVWVFVAILEEGVYRGFLMTEVANIAGRSGAALALNILFASIVFGLSHGYQGRSGIVSTGIIGLILGAIFAWSGFNLWLAIFTHGFIDTVGIGLIALDADKLIRRTLWKSAG